MLTVKKLKDYLLESSTQDYRGTKIMELGAYK